MNEEETDIPWPTVFRYVKSKNLLEFFFFCVSILYYVFFQGAMLR